MDCMTDKLLLFTDKFDGKVERRRRGKTLHFGRAITTLLDELRFSDIDGSFDRSGKITTGGSNRFPR